MKMRNYLRLILYAISFGYQVYAQERISFSRQLENVKEETAALKQQMGEVTISLNNQLKEETTALRNQLTEETTILRNQLTEETTTLRNRVRELERLNDQKIQKDSARVKQIEDNLNVVIKVVKREFGKDLLIDVANIDDSENTQVDKLEIKMVKVQKFLKNEFGEVFIEQPSKFDELTAELSELENNLNRTKIEHHIKSKALLTKIKKRDQEINSRLDCEYKNWNWNKTSSGCQEPKWLYGFKDFTFTTCGRVNSKGPSLRDCKNSYMYQGMWVNHDNLFNVRHEGVQEWTVPETSIYEFEVYGANGGNPNSTDWGKPGKGAFVYGDVWLTKGEKIYVSVGHEGFQRSAIGKMAFGGGGYGNVEDRHYGHGWSGGGLTFVSTVPSPFSDQNAKTNLLFLAGGGGGPAGAFSERGWDADGGDSSYPDGNNGENTDKEQLKPGGKRIHPGGKGGTKSNGGLGGGDGGSGSYGFGGNGSETKSNGIAGGGGGGGLYGGGAGNHNGGGGGGGSSWINTSLEKRNYGGKTRVDGGKVGKVYVRKLRRQYS